MEKKFFFNFLIPNSVTLGRIEKANIFDSDTKKTEFNRGNHVIIILEWKAYNLKEPGCH